MFCMWLMAEQIDEQTAFTRSAAPFKLFMLSQVREKDLGLFMDMANAEPIASPAEAPLQILIPAFMISELRRAFEIGFLLFVPEKEIIRLKMPIEDGLKLVVSGGIVTPAVEATALPDR